MATYDDSCYVDNPNQPQCKAAQALAPFRYIVSCWLHRGLLVTSWAVGLPA